MIQIHHYIYIYIWPRRDDMIKSQKNIHGRYHLVPYLQVLTSTIQILLVSSFDRTQSQRRIVLSRPVSPSCA